MSSLTKNMVDLYKKMIDAQDRAQVLRLEGKDFVIERTRAKRLEDNFNEEMKGLNKEDQKTVLYLLYYEDLIPIGIMDAMEVFDGTFDSIKTDYRTVALSVLETIKTKSDHKTILEMSAHSIKHMGFSWDDYYKIMAEIRKIIKMP